MSTTNCDVIVSTNCDVIVVIFECVVIERHEIVVVFIQIGFGGIAESFAHLVKRVVGGSGCAP